VGTRFLSEKMISWLLGGLQMKKKTWWPLGCPSQSSVKKNRQPLGLQMKEKKLGGH